MEVFAQNDEVISQLDDFVLCKLSDCYLNGGNIGFKFLHLSKNI